MSDSFHQHAPPDAGVWIPSIDLEADVCAWGQIQLASGTSAEGHHALVKEVVDRKNDWPYFAIDEPDPADVMRAKAPDTFGVGHRLKLARSGTQMRHGSFHGPSIPMHAVPQ